VQIIYGYRLTREVVGFPVIAWPAMLCFAAERAPQSVQAFVNKNAVMFFYRSHLTKTDDRIVYVQILTVIES
jgi:hypothetical protein